MTDKYDLPWNQENHLFCALCGRQMKLKDGDTCWFWACPKWLTWLSLDLGTKHDVTALLHYKPRPNEKYDRKTGVKI